MQWYHEPPFWTDHDDSVTLQTAMKTDFWRLTHAGYVADNGHFYYQQVQGNFLAEVKISGKYSELYDQAGLMVRVNETTWLKCGIEFLDGIQHVSTVVTRDYSDWSIGLALSENTEALWLRLKREGVTLEVSYSLDGNNYQLFRQTFLSSEEAFEVGLMAASPIGSGFAVTFEDFHLQTL